MTPLKWARIEICGTCLYRKAEAGWGWPRCTHAGRPFELNDNAFDGADSDCPAGGWDGLDITEAERTLAGGSGTFARVEPTAYQKAVAERYRLCSACDEQCPIAERFKRKGGGRCSGFIRVRLERPSYACLHHRPLWGPMPKGLQENEKKNETEQENEKEEDD